MEENYSNLIEEYELHLKKTIGSGLISEKLLEDLKKSIARRFLCKDEICIKVYMNKKGRIALGNKSMNELVEGKKVMALSVGNNIFRLTPDKNGNKISKRENRPHLGIRKFVKTSEGMVIIFFKPKDFGLSIFDFFDASNKGKDVMLVKEWLKKGYKIPLIIPTRGIGYGDILLFHKEKLLNIELTETPFSTKNFPRLVFKMLKLLVNKKDGVIPILIAKEGNKNFEKAKKNINCNLFFQSGGKIILTDFKEDWEKKTILKLLTELLPIQ